MPTKDDSTRRVASVVRDFAEEMSPEEYRAIARRLFAGARPGDLGISAAGRFLGVSERTGQLYAERGPNKPAAKLLRLMLAFKLTPEEVDDCCERFTARGRSKRRR